MSHLFGRSPNVALHGETPEHPQQDLIPEYVAPGRQRIIPERFLAYAALLGFVATLAAFLFGCYLDRARAKEHFHQVAVQHLAVVRANVIGVLDTTSLLASHFENTDDKGSSRTAFRNMVAPVLAKHRYIQALEWIPRVSSSQRPALERLARKDGLYDFRLVQPGPRGDMVTELPRDEYFPVFYLEPMIGNERALGYDLATDPVRMAAMQEALTTGKTVASGRIRLVQEQGDQYGTLIFTPVYSADIADPQQALKGYVSAVIRDGDFVSLSDSDSRTLDSAHLVDIHLFDLSEEKPERQLYPSTKESPEGLQSGLHADAVFDMGGRSWLLIATPGPGFVGTPISFGSYAVLCAGLFITAVFVAYLRLRFRRSERIRQAEREIERLNRMLSSRSSDR
jgi:CHASE1-domain containing sensor protein